MNDSMKFKYPVFYTIIFATFGLFVVTATLLMCYIGVSEAAHGHITFGMDEWIFGGTAFVFMFVFFVFVVKPCLMRLKYSFMSIVLDETGRRMFYKQFNTIFEMKFSEVISTQDNPLRSVLVLKGRHRTINIPKEIPKYKDLYKRLEANGVLNESFDFDGFKTALGSVTKFKILLLIVFIPFLYYLVLKVMIDFDGSFKAIVVWTFVITLCIVPIIQLVFFIERYEFTEDGFWVKNPLCKKLISYSNIKEVEAREFNRTLLIQLKDDKFDLIRLYNIFEFGISIHEPGNVSMERIKMELESRKRQAQFDSFFAK